MKQVEMKLNKNYSLKQSSIDGWIDPNINRSFHLSKSKPIWAVHAPSVTSPVKCLCIGCDRRLVSDHKVELNTNISFTTVTKPSVMSKAFPAR